MLLLALGLSMPESFAQKRRTKVPSSYREIFKDRSKVERYDGFFNLYRYDKKIYLEIPEKLLGRELLISSVITNSSDLYMTGREAAPYSFFKIESTDSLILFSESESGLVLDPKDEFLARALEDSRQDATVMAFPIAKRNNKGQAVLIDATALLEATSQRLFNPKNDTYAGFRMTIQSFISDIKTAIPEA